MNEKIKINRAPVLTLWATVVTERMGYHLDEALTLAKVLAGLNAQSKRRRLGIYPERLEGEKPEKNRQRQVPAINTKDGIRAIDRDKPVSPQSVQRYLETKFGDALPRGRKGLGCESSPRARTASAGSRPAAGRPARRSPRGVFSQCRCHPCGLWKLQKSHSQ